MYYVLNTDTAPITETTPFITVCLMVVKIRVYRSIGEVLKVLCQDL